MPRRALEHLVSLNHSFDCENARILILDDEPLVTRYVTACLRLAGFREIESTNDPSTILDVMDAFQPDLLLLDIKMPQISGLEILKSIRAQSVWRETIVVMLSAATKAEKYRALRLGAIDFIDKPVSAEHLNQRVRLALRVI